MRCFIAIDIDETVKAALTDLQEALVQSVNLRPGDVKWVRPEAMHLTLKFLGETPDAHIADICRITQTVAQRHPCFDLNLEGVGSFGGRSARVLWIGVTLGQQALQALQADLENELDQAGWPKEGRAYSAHLTLCRIKAPPAGHRLVEAIKPYDDFEAGLSPIAHVTLYQSELHPQGPRYTPLGHFPLKDK